MSDTSVYGSAEEVQQQTKDAKEEITTELPVEKEQKKTYIGIIKSNPAYDDVSQIFHWKDPFKSGLLFGIFNFFFFLISWGEYTVVTLVSYLLLALLAVCLGYSNYVVLKASWIQGKHAENPFKERFKNAKFHMSKQTAQKHLDTFVDLVNLTIDNFRDVFYCTSTALSLQYLGYFFALATVGKWFSGLTVIYLTLLTFFVWPRLYQEKQKEIDQIYAIAMEQIGKYVHLGLSKLPPAVTARLPFLKPHNQ